MLMLVVVASWDIAVKLYQLVSNRLAIHNEINLWFPLLHWLLGCSSSGDQFLCGVAVLAFAGATWATALVLNFCHLLFNGRDFREKKCGRNQREIASRN